MKLKDWTPSRFSVLCVNHFEEHYIDKTGKSVKLREDAVPTIFSKAKDTQKNKTKVASSYSSVNSFKSVSTFMVLIPNCSFPSNRIPQLQEIRKPRWKRPVFSLYFCNNCINTVSTSIHVLLYIFSVISWFIFRFLVWKLRCRVQISPQRLRLQPQNKTAQTRTALRRQRLQGNPTLFTQLSQLHIDQLDRSVCVSLMCVTSDFRDLKKPEKWRIITDAGLLKISSFPYFFHGDYCVSQASENHFLAD